MVIGLGVTLEREKVILGLVQTATQNERTCSAFLRELLDREIFYTLLEAKVLIERWRVHYNRIRPHSSLGYRPPAPEAIAFSALAAGCAPWPRDSTPPAADLAAGACWTNIESGTMDGGRSPRDQARQRHHDHD